MKEFTVVREKWCRGTKSTVSLLRSSDDTMCCLGFMAKELGYSDEEILDVGDPADKRFSSGRDLWPNELIAYSCLMGRELSDIGTKIVDVNDDDIGLFVANDQEREAELKRLFEQIGILVHFE